MTASQPAAPAQVVIERDWAFVPSEVHGWRRRAVVRAVVLRSCRRPAFDAVRAAVARPQWILFFVYVRDGALSDAQRDSLARLRAEGLALLVVWAGSRSPAVTDELLRHADALYWKENAGYDFSAYALGLAALAHASPGADVLVLNDSVFGPCAALRPFLETAPWQLTGFTASGQIENHIQSYAFVLRGVTPARLRRLWPVLFPLVALSDRDDVIFCQETRLARVASRSMTVGAHWYCAAGDATQRAPFQLLRQGFPFVKRSLLDARSSFADKAAVAAYVAAARR